MALEMACWLMLNLNIAWIRVKFNNETIINVQGGWLASASTDAEWNTGTQAHAVAARPEPAVTLPAAG